MRETLIKKNCEELLNHAAATILDRAWKAYEERGRCTIALAGGNAPKALYRQLAKGIKTEHFQQFGMQTRHSHHGRVMLPTRAMLFFQGDERCVPPNHPDSNYRMAEETLLAPYGVPEESVIRMEGENPSVQEAAAVYETMLRSLFPPEGRAPGDFPIFDIILLGLGSDGHTASLFPGDKETLGECRQWVIPVHAPGGKPPGWRLTLTLPVINSARTVIIYAPGEDKKAVIRNIIEKRDSHYPGTLVDPHGGELLWFTDMP